MPLTVPEFSLQVGAPHQEGLVTQFGLSRDWRCYSEVSTRDESCPWELRNAEYIEALKAIAPTGLAYPRDMDGWQVQSGSHWRSGHPDWCREAQSWGWTDGSVYGPGAGLAAGGQLVTTSAHDDAVPRFALWMERKPPPPTQGVGVYVAVGLPALKLVDGAPQPARIALYLPLAQSSDESGYAWSEPFLHCLLESEITDNYGYIGSAYSFATDGKILSRGPRSSAMQQGGGREGWIFEVEEDEELYSGSHILIRCVTDDADRYWHYHSRLLRVVSTSEAVAEGASWADGRWQVRVQGAPAIINLTPLRYGDNDAYAWPREERPLPDEVAANDVEADSYSDAGAAAWNSLNSCPSGWSVTADAPPDGSRRPLITFSAGESGAWGERPVLWFATETHRATIGDAASGERDDTDTEGVHRLIDVRWTWGRDWKQSEGEATFSPEAEAYCEDWRENANVLLRLGWSEGAGEGLEADVLAQGYILPGGLPRGRSGDEAHGDPRFGPVRFGSYDVARLPQKQVIDVRQAGGMTVIEWAEQILGDALGIDRIYTDAGVASIIIPPHSIPSLPALAPRDGSSWEAHIAEVERAAGIRVCWNRDPSYDLWIDAGPPEYEEGVSEIALEIEYQATADADKLLNIEHEATGAGFRNRLKAIAGPPDDLSEYYYAADLAERKATIGDDWPVVIEQEDAEVGELYEEFRRLHGEASAAQLHWTMPMRPDLRPDMFVRVTDCPGIGATTDAVYRIETHTLQTHAQEAWAESIITAVRVYEPAGDGYGY
jgi:hypothetical protein